MKYQYKISSRAIWGNKTDVFVELAPAYINRPVSCKAELAERKRGRGTE